MRRRTRNRLILAVLVLAALPFAFKGLMWWQVKLAVDDFIARVADQAEIHYQAIETDWDGATSVVGIQLRPQSFERAITIERVRLETEDPAFLLDLRNRFGTDTLPLPEQLALTAFDVSVPLEEIIAHQRRNADQATTDPETACATFTLAPQLLQALGMNTLHLDIHSRYAFDRTAERLAMWLTLDLQDIERVELEMRLLGLVPEDLQDQRVARARLDGARLAFEIDPDFGQQLAGHCAERLGLSGPEAYVEQLLTQTRAQLAEAGIEVGEALQRALTDYHRHWGRIELDLRPPEPLAPLQLATIPPEQIVSRLGMSLVVNGRPVLPLEIRFRSLAPVTVSPATSDVPGSVTGKPPAGYRIQRRYRTISVANLGDHLGEKVRIRPRGQPSREGVLIAVVNGEAQLEQRVPGGTMEAYVPLIEIESVEVEEKIKVPWTPDSGVRSVPAK